MTDIPAWKKNKVTAGAMMLLKGYVIAVSICDHCQRTLERADGLIDVIFQNGEAQYPCPHCRQPSVRKVGAR